MMQWNLQKKNTKKNTKTNKVYEQSKKRTNQKEDLEKFKKRKIL
jgi:hypothetical protein